MFHLVIVIVERAQVSIITIFNTVYRWMLINSLGLCSKL
jgi:hypothetical protein